MWTISAVTLRDASTKALLLRLDGSRQNMALEETATSLLISDARTGASLVSAPVAALELIDADGIHYLAAARIRDSTELRRLWVTITITRPPADRQH